MPSPSPSASRSSTSFARALLAAAGLAVVVLAAERRRHRLAEARLRRDAADREARLRAEAEERERERARLAGDLITAEQEERRRLSVALHDGPLGSLSGIVLMTDAALSAVREGRSEEAASLLEGGLARARATMQTMRDLSFAMEPVVLRDQSFEVAVCALAEQFERAGLRVEVAAADGDRLGEKAQVALFQTLREALTQASLRKPGRIEVRVRRNADGSVEASVVDDGSEERRRANVAALEERARLLGARVGFETGPAGTAVRLAIAPYVAESPA